MNKNYWKAVILAYFFGSFHMLFKEIAQLGFWIEFLMAAPFFIIACLFVIRWEPQE